MLALGSIERTARQPSGADSRMPVAGAWRFTLQPSNEGIAPSAEPPACYSRGHDTKLVCSLSITADHPVPDQLSVTNDAW
jgi:hypothetical protein